MLPLVQLVKAEMVELNPSTRLEAARKAMNLLDEAAVETARLLQALGFKADKDLQ